MRLGGEKTGIEKMLFTIKKYRMVNVECEDEDETIEEVHLKSDEFKIVYDLSVGEALGKLPQYYTYRDGADLPDTVRRKGRFFVEIFSMWRERIYLDKTSVKKCTF